MTEAQAAARRVLAYAAAAGATQAEVLFSEGDSALTRFANSEIHQNVTERDAQVSLRFVDGRRVGCAATNRLDDEALRRLADRAAAIARLQPEQEEAVELPEPGPIPMVEGASSRSTRDGVAGVARRGRPRGHRRRRCRRRPGLRLVHDQVQRIGVINSEGVDVVEERTSAALITVSMGRDGEAGYASSSAVDVTDIDAAAVGREAAERARDSRGAVAIESGRLPVVLEPYAVADLLETLGYVGFSALAVQEDRSFHEPGRVVGSDLVTIVDDATDPAGMPASFDYEGVAKERVTLIERGRLPRRGLRRPDGEAGRRRLHRPRPAGPELLRPVPAQHAHGARRRLARGARPRPRPRPHRDALPLHEPGPSQAGHRDRHDPRRPLPRRARARSSARSGTCASRRATWPRWPVSRRSVATDGG